MGYRGFELRRENGASFRGWGVTRLEVRSEAVGTRGSPRRAGALRERKGRGQNLRNLDIYRSRAECQGRRRKGNPFNPRNTMYCAQVRNLQACR